MSATDQGLFDRPWDVLVIGGGPAGATTAALLAERGHEVLVLERERFPRYHIGESLIPYCFPTLQRLGLIKKLTASAFIKKYSVQFVSTNGTSSQPFYFFQHIKHQLARTWQVLRSDFDLMLLDRARELGARVAEQTTVRELIWDDSRVTGLRIQDSQGQLHELNAKMVVDASGRDAISMKSQGWRKSDPKLNKIAVWSYFKGAKRDPGLDQGATTVAYLPQKGWFWYIPLPDDIVSVGAVAEADYLYRDGRDAEAIYQRELQVNPWIADHIAGATRTAEVKITGDYSYRSQHCAADGLVLVGDAFAFLDPVFSSGVFLALKSGSMAADTIHHALLDNDLSASRFDDYGRALCASIEAMRKLVYAFYDEGFHFGEMLRKHPDLQGTLTDCLIGNLDRDMAPLWEAVADFASLPNELPHGSPLIPASS